MLNSREKFITLVSNEPLKRAEAIVLLEGDGYGRIPQAVKLYRQKWAPRIVISGGVDKAGTGRFPAKKLSKRLNQLGVKLNDIIIDEKSRHTRDQALNIMALAKKNKWKKIILVASPYHQFRALLTFLKAMNEAKTRIQIINAPARDLPWFRKNRWGKRFDLLETEFNKIEQYSRKNHIVSFDEAIAYQAWKEKES